MLEIKINSIPVDSIESVEIIHALDTLPIYANVTLCGDQKHGDALISIDKTIILSGNVITKTLDENERFTKSSLLIADKTYAAYKSNTFCAEWEQSSISLIASSLLKKHNILTSFDVDSVVGIFSTYPTDNLFEKLDELAEYGDLLVISNGKGIVKFCKKNKKTHVIKNDFYSKREVTTYTTETINIFIKDRFYSSGYGDITKNYISSKDILNSKKRIISYEKHRCIVKTTDFSCFLRYNIGDTMLYNNKKFILFSKKFYQSIDSGTYVELEMRLDNL